MRHVLSTVLLGPLLLGQGWWVRRVTPVLPEPPGERTGVSGRGPVLRLLVLGDSSAAGVGAAHQAEALLGQLVARLSRTHTVHWCLRATSGHRLKDVGDGLARQPADPADVVVLAIGVNDATGGTRLPAWRAGLVRLLGRVRAQTGARHVLVSSLPPVHHFPALPQPLRWYLGERAARLQRVLRDVVWQQTGCELVAFDMPMQRALMAEDGFHPGPLAYARWADALSGAIGRRLA